VGATLGSKRLEVENAKLHYYLATHRNELP
jgi:hypothetical protein